MSRRPVFVNRLNERGDLVRVEVAPDGYSTPPGRATPPQERSPSPPLPPPPPPEQLEAMEQVKAVTLPQINKEFKAINIGQSSETTVKSPTTPIAPTPLRLYADKDIRALEKNPMHNDIMSAAEAFKGRRDVHSVSEDHNSADKDESVPVQTNDSNYVRIVTRGPLQRYDPDEMRKKKQHGPVSGEVRWNESKPFEKRTTFRVVPNSQVPSFIANAQDNIDQKRTEEAASSTNGVPYKKKEEVPDVDALLEHVATHDEKGKPIPDWKRKLMARNYRVKLSSQLQ